ncbi:MAG TPA: hypothetical protein VIN57_01460 [Magnetovibrio sp.]
MTKQHDYLTLKTQVDPSGSGSGNEGGGPKVQPPRDDSLPLLGLFAAGFSTISIFAFGPIFAPLGLVLGIIALFIGQVGLGILAIFLAVIGILTSPTLLIMLGMGALHAWLLGYGM